MNKLTACLAVTFLVASNLSMARDMGGAEIQKLHAAGAILSVEKLNATAVAKHPGALIEESDFEQERGMYVYSVDLRDAQGAQWDLELNAATGDVIEDHRD